MITTGLSLAILTMAGFSFIYVALPARIRQWMVDHPLVTRVACFLTAYTVLGGTLIALFAGAFLDLFVSILLAIQRNPDAKRTMDHFMKKIGDLKKQIIDQIAKQAPAEAPAAA